MRLIDADKLKEDLDSGSIVIDEGIEKCESMHEVLVYLLAKVEACVIEKIDAQPTVERSGYWIYDKDATDWGIGGYRCSECGCRNNNLGISKSPFSVMNFFGSKYCPHCGVKMEGEKNERD